MSKRLQVLFPDDEYNTLRKHAKNSRLSLGEWVRSALRRVTDDQSSKSIEQKLRVLGQSSQLEAPITDPPQLKSEILRGYSK